MGDRGAFQNISTLDEVTYQEYYDAIVSVEFEGATGKVSIDKSNGNRIGYSLFLSFPLFIFSSFPLFFYPLFSFSISFALFVSSLEV